MEKKDLGEKSNEGGKKGKKSLVKRDFPGLWSKKNHETHHEHHECCSGIPIPWEWPLDPGSPDVIPRQTEGAQALELQSHTKSCQWCSQGRYLHCTGHCGSQGCKGVKRNWIFLFRAEMRGGICRSWSCHCSDADSSQTQPMFLCAKLNTWIASANIFMQNKSQGC